MTVTESAAAGAGSGSGSDVAQTPNGDMIVKAILDEILKPAVIQRCIRRVLQR